MGAFSYQQALARAALELSKPECETSFHVAIFLQLSA